MIPYAMPAQLFAGGDGGRLTDVTDRAGPPWQVPRVGRGLAVGDLDNDGRIDLLIVSPDEPLAYLHNRTERRPLLTLPARGDRLEPRRRRRAGRGRPPAAVARSAWRVGGGSYQSASDPRLHFGLGEADRVEAVEVTWPSGRVDRFDGLPADAGYLLREGDAAPRPLAGRRS